MTSHPKSRCSVVTQTPCSLMLCIQLDPYVSSFTVPHTLKTNQPYPKTILTSFMAEESLLGCERWLGAVILLPQPLKYQGCRCVLPCPARFILNVTCNSPSEKMWSSSELESLEAYKGCFVPPLCNSAQPLHPAIEHTPSHPAPDLSSWPVHVFQS